MSFIAHPTSGESSCHQEQSFIFSSDKSTVHFQKRRHPLCHRLRGHSPQPKLEAHLLPYLLSSLLFPPPPGEAGQAHQRGISPATISLKSNANSVPKPTPAHISHPVPILEEPQQRVQTISLLVPAMAKITSNASTLVLEPQHLLQLPPLLGSLWTAPGITHMPLPHAASGFSQPAEPDASKSNLLPSSGSSAHLLPTDMGLDHSETGHSMCYCLLASD